MTESEVLTSHVTAFYGALKNLDLVMLDKLYSDKYMLVRSDGSVLNKHQVLEDLRDNGLTFQSIELRQDHVRLLGSVAILTGESRVVSSRNGEETCSEFRLVAVYLKQEAAIQLVHFQSTPLDNYIAATCCP